MSKAKSAKERHRRLLAAGFFAPELPPAFTSADFGTNRDAILKHFKSLPKAKGDYLSHMCKLYTFRYPRFLNTDRRHSILNPIPYFALSEHLSDSYLEIRKSARKSKISISRPMFDWEGTRAIKRPSFEAREAFATHLAAYSNYIVSTDVAAFYHSIYTHSIPWALHTKKVAKAKKTDLSLLGNMIDKLVRNGQDGQTLGLPVGPDTSRLIAELIGSAVDVEIQSKLKKLNTRCVRLVDDYALGCDTKHEADLSIAIIRRALNSFELEINNTKTGVVEAHRHSDSTWKDFIKGELPKGSFKLPELNRFFYQIGELGKHQPTSNVLKFGLGNARKTFVLSDEWKPIQQFLLASYKANSTLIDLLVTILIQRHQIKNDLDKEPIIRFLNSRIPSLIGQQRNGEVFWLIYLARVLRISLKAKLFEQAELEFDSLMCAQLAESDAQGLIVGKLPYSVWNQCLVTDELNGENWLYAYETALAGNNKSTKGDAFIKKHKFFSFLYEKKISFYQPQLNVPEFQTVMKQLKHENQVNKKLLDLLEDDFNLDFDDLDEIDDLDFNEEY